MGRLPAITICALLLLGHAPATAADRIFTYRGPDGSLMFTDRDQARVPREYTLLSVRKGWEYKPRALTPAIRDRFDATIEYAALSNRVEPALIKAVIHAESHFDPHAISRAGAQGLMQLMPETAAYLQVHQPFDPRQNIMGGARFLSYLMGKFDTLPHVLAAYNAGEGNVRRHGGIPPFPETQRYVTKVTELLDTYRSQFGDALAQR